MKVVQKVCKLILKFYIEINTEKEQMKNLIIANYVKNIYKRIKNNKIKTLNFTREFMNRHTKV